QKYGQLGILAKSSIRKLTCIQPCQVLFTERSQQHNNLFENVIVGCPGAYQWRKQLQQQPLEWCQSSFLPAMVQNNQSCQNNALNKSLNKLQVLVLVPCYSTFICKSA